MDTRELLIHSFKELLLKHPFKKITIKMITDHADVIRPTFYNHFQDKYEIFSIILDEELFDSLYDLIDIEMFREATKMVFTYFDKNRLFYERAFEVTGQNSFKEILTEKTIDLVAHIVQSNNISEITKASNITMEQLAKYYSMELILVIEMWFQEDIEHQVDANEIFEIYTFLVTHSLQDFFEY